MNSARRWKRRAYVMVAVGFALATVTLTRLRAGSSAVDEAAGRTVQAQAMIQRLTLIGRIEPAVTATLAAPFDGELEAVFAEEGQRVEAGTVVARLGTADLELRLRDALAERLKAERLVAQLDQWGRSPEVGRAQRVLSAAKGQLEDSERKLADSRALLAQGIVARMEVDGLVQQVQSAQLAAAAAQEELQSLLSKPDGAEREITRMALQNASAKYVALQLLLARREVTAPFAGILIKPPGVVPDGGRAERLQAGGRVLRGQPLLGLVSAEHVKAVAKVDEADLRQLRVGQAVDISGDGFEGSSLTGTISGLGAQALVRTMDGGAARYEVSVSIPILLPEQSRLIRLGMSANLSVTTYANPIAMLLPLAAIRTIGGRSFIRLVDGPARPPRTVEIRPGRTFPTGVEVEGLKTGTAVLIGE